MPCRAVSSALALFCTLWLAPGRAGAQDGSLAALAARSRPALVPGTEQEWIVRTVAERMWVLAHLGAASPPPPTVAVATVAASPAVFTVTVGDQPPVTVRVVNHLWDPATYLPLAGPLGVTSVPSGAATAADDQAETARLLAALTTPSTAVLLEEEARLSAALRATRSSVAAHDRAALLLAAHALREGAGVFSDARPAWSRMTAHLAIAAIHADGRGPSPAGALARAVLLTELGREVDALGALTPLWATSQPPAVQAWARALRVRATGDWRLVSKPASATMIERLEFGRALRRRVGDSRLLAWFDESDQPIDLLWTRIVLSSSFSVEAGTTMAGAALAAEVADAALVAARYQQDVGADLPRLVAALARATGGADAAAFGVLDWPLLAATAERHLAGRLKALYDAEWSLGRDEALRRTPALLEKEFAGLALLPAALALMGGDQAARHLSAAAALVRTRQDRIPPALWTALMDAGAARARGVSWATPEVWFNPWIPDGTVLKPIERSLRPSKHQRPPVPMLEAYHRQAPSDTWVSWALAWWRLPSGPPTIAATVAESGPALAYDAGALERIYDNLDGSHADYVRLATALCEIDVDRCDELAGELLKEGKDAEAADEYRRWFARARNRVAASTGVLWLVRYLHEGGHAAQARPIAEAAAAVHSGGGMSARAEWLERSGDVAGAEAGYRTMHERYSTGGWQLGAFYLRQGLRSGDPVVRDRGLALVADRFPAGLEVAPSGAEAPLDGVRFTNFGQRAARAGLRRTDILVGVDGVRVRSTSQLDVLMRASHSTALTFTVWRDGRYETITATLPQRWLGVSRANYRSPSPSM